MDHDGRLVDGYISSKGLSDFRQKNRKLLSAEASNDILEDRATLTALKESELDELKKYYALDEVTDVDVRMILREYDGSYVQKPYKDGLRLVDWV